MNHCAIQQGSALSACEDMRSVVCPKPRRFGLVNAGLHDPVRSFRWHLGHQTEFFDSKTGFDMLENILTKGEQFSCTEVASPHPFYSGSPPGRVDNPLIQDARFGDEKITPFSPLSPTPSLSAQPSSPSSSTRKGGCVRASFGSKPVVRVEGFDCLDRDRRNCSIATLA